MIIGRIRGWWHGDFGGVVSHLFVRCVNRSVGWGFGVSGKRLGYKRGGFGRRRSRLERGSGDIGVGPGASGGGLGCRREGFGL